MTVRPQQEAMTRLAVFSLMDSKRQFHDHHSTTACSTGTCSCQIQTGVFTTHTKYAEYKYAITLIQESFFVCTCFEKVWRILGQIWVLVH